MRDDDVMRFVAGLLMLSAAVLMPTGRTAAQSDSASSGPPGISVQLVGPEAVMFDWSRDKCDERDVVDAGPRAFRDDRGEIHFIASSSVNRAWMGPGLSRLRHDCRVVYRGGDDDDPAHYNDKQWLTSFFTTDGHRIYALVPNEFWGHLRPGLCRSGVYQKCWANALTYAVSDDGGFNFAEPQPPRNLVATVPYPYVGDRGFPAGYFQPTNIIYRDGYYYVMFFAAHLQAQQQGYCVMRTQNLFDSGSWRGWDGQGYAVTFADPARGALIDPAAHVCQPVGQGKLVRVGSLSFFPAADLFVATVTVQQELGPGHPVPGFYVSTSPDLVHWSEDELVLSWEQADRSANQPTWAYAFPSLMDPGSPDRNFSSVSDRAMLFYVRMFRQGAPLNRQLVSRDVRITVRP